MLKMKSSRTYNMTRGMKVIHNNLCIIEQDWVSKESDLNSEFNSSIRKFEAQSFKVSNFEAQSFKVSNFEVQILELEVQSFKVSR